VVGRTCCRVIRYTVTASPKARVMVTLGIGPLVTEKPRVNRQTTATRDASSQRSRLDSSAIEAYLMHDQANSSCPNQVYGKK
jgi:hypothetical protein